MNNTFLIVLLFFLFSCNKNKETNSALKKEQIIDLSEITDEVFDCKKNIKDFFYVPLATNDKNLLSSIKSINANHSNIWVSDSRKVCCFSKSGKSIYTIDRMGRGPEEYNSIWDICTNSQFLFILDNNGSKVLLFDIKTGEFKHSITTPSSLIEMEANEEFLIFNTTNGLNDSRYNYEIATYQICKKSWKYYLKMQESDFTPLFESQLTKHGDTIIYTNAMHNLVRKILPNGTFKNYSIVDFDGTKQVKFLNKLKNGFKKRADLNASGLSFGIHQWYETADYAIFKHIRTKEPQNILYSKKERKCFSMNITRWNLPYFRFSMPVATQNDFFVSYVDACVFKRFKPIENASETTKKRYCEIKDVKANDNPVLIFYKL